MSDVDAQIPIAEQLAEEYPQRKTKILLANTLSVLAHRYQDAGEDAEACYVLDRAVGVAVDYPVTYATYAVVLVKQERLEAAEFMLRRAASWQKRDTATGVSDDQLIYDSKNDYYLKVARLAAAQNKWDAVARNVNNWHLQTPQDSDTWRSWSPLEKSRATKEVLELDTTSDVDEQLQAAFESIAK